MALVSYPLSLPAPLQKGYSGKFTPAVLLEDGEKGWQSQRLLSYGAPETLTISIMLTTQAEYRTWLHFIESLDNGNDWFSITLLDRNYRCRIQNGKWTETLNCRTETKVIRELKMTLDAELIVE